MSDYWDDEEEFEGTVEQTQPRRASRRRRTDEARGNLYLLTGLIIGLGLGLFIAWVIFPVQYVDIDPGALSPKYKSEYRRMIAMAYSADRNLERARERALLVDGNSAVPLLAAQAQQMLSENRPANQARALAVLAADLARPEEKALAPSLEATSAPVASGGESVMATETAAALATTAATQAVATQEGSVSAAVQTPTQPIPTGTQPPTVTPTITRTPIPTFTPRPTATTQAGVIDAPFVLSDRTEICDPSLPGGLLQIQVTNEDGDPLPGARISISWQNLTEDFYTGLIPENGLGYADFLMQPGITYRVQVGSAGEPTDFQIPACGGGWLAEFAEGQP